MQEFVTLTDLIEEVMNKSGYIASLEQARTMEADARIDNMREFLSVAKEFEEQRLDTQAERITACPILNRLVTSDRYGKRRRNERFSNHLNDLARGKRT